MASTKQAQAACSKTRLVVFETASAWGRTHPNPSVVSLLGSIRSNYSDTIKKRRRGEAHHGPWLAKGARTGRSLSPGLLAQEQQRHSCRVAEFLANNSKEQRCGAASKTNQAARVPRSQPTTLCANVCSWNGHWPRFQAQCGASSWPRALAQVSNPRKWEVATPCSPNNIDRLWQRSPY